MSLTASSNWSAWQPRAPGTLKAQWRLGTFVAASVILHALTFGSYSPGSAGREVSPGDASQPVLRAALVHEHVPEQPPGIAPQASAQIEQQNVASPSTQAVGSAAAESRGMMPMPVPERWYEAAELDRRAEPLTPVEPAYPPVLAGLTAVHAKVRLRLFIDERGAVRKLEIAMAGPHPEFDEAAKRAWEGVRFSPAMKEGVSVKSQKLLELAFAPY